MCVGCETEYKPICVAFTQCIGCLCSVVTIHWIQRRRNVLVSQQNKGVAMYWLWNQYIALPLFVVKPIHCVAFIGCETKNTLRCLCIVSNQYIASPLFCCETNVLRFCSNRIQASPLFCCETNTLRCLCSVVKPMYCVSQQKPKAFVLLWTQCIAFHKQNKGVAMYCVAFISQ